MRNLLITLLLAFYYNSLPYFTTISFAQEVLSSLDDMQLNIDDNVGSIQRGTDSIDVHCTHAAKQPWDLQLQTPAIDRALDEDEVLCLELEANLLSESQNQPGKLSVYFQNTKDYTGVGKDASGTTFRIEPTRQKFVFCVRLRQAYQPGDVNVSLHAASQLQSFAIHSVQLTSLGKVSPDEIPFQPLHYERSASDQRTIEQAQQRINDLRKSDIVVRILDAQGNGIANIPVHVAQQRHRYAFGSFTDAGPMLDSPERERYRETMRRMFNRVTLPRYWTDWGTESEAGLKEADDLADWAVAEGFELKTHLLLYPAYLPKRVIALKGSPAQFQQEILIAVDAALQRTSKYDLAAWDLTNELRDDSHVLPVLGESFVVDLFNRANQAQPDARWFINENNILTGEGNQDANVQNYLDRITRLTGSGAAVEGIGMQGHFQGILTPMTKIQSILDQFAAFNLPIEITEFDIDTRDEPVQAQYTRDLLTVFFAHPATTGFTTWGFWEGSMWRPNGAMYRKNWDIKPNGILWHDLIYQDWWTDETALTQADGRATVRAFHGKHRITLKLGERTVTREIELGSDGQALKLQLKD